MSKSQKSSQICTMLCDKSQPLEHRLDMFRMVAIDDGPAGLKARQELLGLLESVNGEAVHAAKVEQLSQLMNDLQEGPYRPAFFIRMMSANNGGPSHLAQVLLDDGSTAYTVVPDEKHGKPLQVGDRILLDRQAKALLHRAADELKIGEEARLERCLPHGRVEVSLRGDERAVFLASQRLLDKIESEEAGPGTTLVVNSRLSLALDVVPQAEGLSHYRFLDQSPLPDVTEDDMGAPPPVIKELTEHVRIEMSNPELRRAYGCPRSRCILLTGPPGTGKTMTIKAVTRGTYEVMSEVTGVVVEDLPQCVFHLRMSKVLDPYLGVSDKNLDRFFDEVEERAAETFRTSDGRDIPLPVIAVIEEIDGLALQRGSDHSGVHDRILTTGLQRLDQIRPELRDRLIIFLGTTNELQRVDAAFIRRIGGTIVHFGRLKRQAFAAILRKHLAGWPVANPDDSLSAEEKERALEADLTAWLYSPNGTDPGVVELSFVGSGSPEVRFKRDFLNADLISRSVREACDEAAAAELRDGSAGAGLSLACLARAFDRQIRSVAGQLSEHNSHRYLDLPDGVRVASVRRLPQPAFTPHQLQIS